MSISNLFSSNAYDIHARTFKVPLGCDGVDGAIILASGKHKVDADGKLVRDARGRLIGVDDVKITYESMRTMQKQLQGLIETVACQARQIEELTQKLREKDGFVIAGIVEADKKSGVEVSLDPPKHIL